MDSRTEEMICRVVDGCASQAEDSEVEVMAERDPEVREALAQHREAVSSLRSVGLRELDDDVADQFSRGVYNRLERGVGWVLVVVGVALVTGYALYEFLTEPDIHTVYRLGIAGLLVGFGLLISRVLRMRLRLRKQDKYAEVIR